jgi:2-phosphosulfolactate phosphatase
MEIVRARGIDAAPTARGHVVVIDVLRAFTTAAYALDAGAEKIVLVSTAEEAFALRGTIDGAVLAGEKRGRKVEGFDHGNSPDEISRAELRDRTLVLRSSSGTQGVVRATNAECILLGSLVVASATARWLARNARVVTLLAMGSPDGPDGPEDDACADFLAALLDGAKPDVARTLETVRASKAARLAFDPSVDWISPQDVECATRIDRFAFAMRVRAENGRLVARALPA